MKKYFLLLVFSLALGSLSVSSEIIPDTNASFSAYALNCHHGQCQAIAKSTGQRCKHCVSNSGDRYCYQHK